MSDSPDRPEIKAISEIDILELFTAFDNMIIEIDQMFNLLKQAVTISTDGMKEKLDILNKKLELGLDDPAYQEKIDRFLDAIAEEQEGK